jgi:hypothetical protein
MNTSVWAAIVAALTFSLVGPRMAHAQAVCKSESTTMTCSSDQSCTSQGCRDLIYCTNDAECGAGLGCNVAKYRCNCTSNADCGSVGICNADKLCVRRDEAPECSRSCLWNSECGDPKSLPAYNCTFDEKHPYVGLCCPEITGTNEEDFSCQFGFGPSNPSRTLLLAGLFAAACITGRIRKRSAARKENSRGTRPRA